MNRYAVSSLVGQGSFGCVYKAQRRDDDKVVAIKVISKRGRSNRELKNLRRECDIQARLKNPHVIEMIESFESKFDLFVVTEFALMDLHRYLSFNGAMPEEHARRVIGHLVSALYYLHSNRILHRDLKPQNVLLDKNMHAKLCDFGLARNMTLGTHVLTSIKGTPLYMAPELLAEQPYDHQADMWSLGCIAYESMAGQPPFCATSILHLVKLIKHEDVKWPSTLSSDNTPPCLLPGWDSCDESQSPPIENDEWLAFLHRSIQELMDGEFDSLKQHNLVSIIVAPLRNSKAIPKVLQSVAQLLSLPFVLAEPLMLVDLDLIRNVYVDVKLVPNLMYACKLLLSHRQLSDSAASAPLTLGSLSRTMRSIPELSVEEMGTACSLYELVCHLVHQQQQFLSQFCDAIAILAVNDLFLNFLTHEFKHADSDSSSVRLAGCMLALMSCVLRELPENAELVERIVFSPRLRFAALLQSRHQLLRQRACQLLRLLARFSLRGVHCMWGAELRSALQSLAEQQHCPAVRLEAAQTLDELSQFSFFVA
ncbi:serine/threonine-protein kinase fused isoform X2 [Drosophila guanche]|uniref:serine/threonine-protein kinase fused isoform X2 n=1 Tax=Drosophila guanche TaxID=7266 RepID=UPI0014715E0E|nr:serine/threonine-protein kinase fused isoform X2 [Drosophila guanche]